MVSNIILNGLTTVEFKEMLDSSISRALKEANPVNHQNANNDEFLTRMEVAKLMKITLPTLHDWTKRGLITSYKIGKRVLYKANEVKDSLHERNFLKFKKGGKNA